MVNIDESKPYIDSVDIPEEAPTGETFSVTVKVGNSSTILAPQSGTCQSGIFLTNVAWVTPVVLRVDGAEVARKSKCIDGSSGLKTVTFRVTRNQAGTYPIEVQAIKEPEGTVADETAGTVEISSDADNPAKPSSTEKIMEMLGDFADSIGATTTTLVAGFALALILLAVV